MEQRKFILLRNLPENISLQQLCEELNLDFKEINTIYDNKVNDYRENQKYLKLAKKVQLAECIKVQTDYLTEIHRGLLLRDDYRYCKCGMLFPYHEVEVDDKQQYHMFMCGHMYHEKCIQSAPGKENVFECKECNKGTLEVSKVEIKKAK